METHENIKMLREKLGLSQEDLAQKVGYTDRSSIAKIEAGRVDLSQSKISAFATALGVTPAQLMGISFPNKSLPNNILAVPEMHRIPILGRISAGLPLYAEENIEGYTYTDLNGGAEYFALRVQGDSMTAARIQDGDTLIVRRQEVVENGQIAVVMVGDDEATVKRFYQKGTGITLMPQSTNPAHQPQLYDTRDHNIRVIGLVVKNEISF